VSDVTRSDDAKGELGLQLNFSHTNLPISVADGIGTIPMAERKWHITVVGNICWAKFTTFL